MKLEILFLLGISAISVGVGLSYSDPGPGLLFFGIAILIYAVGKMFMKYISNQ